MALMPPDCTITQIVSSFLCVTHLAYEASFFLKIHVSEWLLRYMTASGKYARSRQVLTHQ